MEQYDFNYSQFRFQYQNSAEYRNHNLNLSNAEASNTEKYADLNFFKRRKYSRINRLDDFRKRPEIK